MTAHDLLRALRAAGCNPTAVGFELFLDTDPPSHLAKYLPVLQTGLRAIMTRRRWYYFARPGTHRAGGELDLAKPLPPTVLLLIVDGDDSYDRVHPAWLVEMPELFGLLPADTRNHSQSRKAVTA